MIRKAFILSIAYYSIAIALTGCICNCPDYPDRRIRWTDLVLNNRVYTIDSFGDARITPDTATDFTQRQYLLLARMNYQFVASAGRRRHPSLINEAYACKCDEATVFAENPVAAIRVYSLGDFDAAHPAGSEVTALFGSPQHINSQPAGIGPLDLGLGTSYIGRFPEIGYYLFLAQRPAAGSEQQFRVEVLLSDSNRYVGQTAVLKF